MIAVHPFLRYAQALIMNENDLSSCDEITFNQIIAEIEKGLNSFRIYPVESIEGKVKVKFDFIKQEKGDTKQGVFLSPNVITKDKQAKNTWKASHDLVKDLQSNPLNNLNDMTMSIAPITGEYLSFSMKGGMGRGKPKCTLTERGLGLVTTLTPYKPCLQYRIDKRGMPEMFNVCIIPDLPVEELKGFIRFFKLMLKTETANDLMYGNVVSTKTGKDNTEKNTYEAKRPLIYRGNFPNPPRSSALGSVALLGTIGEFVKESKFSEQVKSVLESLKETTMYLVKYGGASTFTFNHHVIDLAKEGKLKAIIDSLYYSKLYNQDRRSSSNSEYQKFDLFTSRFLQLFNHAAFKDFLAFRAEYPSEVTILFNTYFIKMEKIDPTIVSSARAMGKWLNQVAYFAAKAEIKENSQNYKEELRKAKSKGLTEIESSIFCAKSGTALIAQTITRAGRLSTTEAPNEATLFIDKTNSGDLLLDDAKNLLIAYSRLNPYTKKVDPLSENTNSDDLDENENADDHSDE